MHVWVCFRIVGGPLLTARGLRRVQIRGSHALAESFFDGALAAAAFLHTVPPAIVVGVATAMSHIVPTRLAALAAVVEAAQARLAPDAAVAAE